jgi:hypothetical protein
MAAVVTEVDVVRRVGEGHGRLPAAQDALDVGRLRGIAAYEAMRSERPYLAGLRPRRPGSLLEGRLEVEQLDPLPALPDIEAAEERLDLVLVEAREGKVDVRPGLELGEEAGEELLVPGARDPVKREPEQASLLRRQGRPG